MCMICTVMTDNQLEYMDDSRLVIHSPLNVYVVHFLLSTWRLKFTYKWRFLPSEWNYSKEIHGYGDCYYKLQCTNFEVIPTTIVKNLTKMIIHNDPYINSNLLRLKKLKISSLSALHDPRQRSNEHGRLWMAWPWLCSKNVHLTNVGIKVATW